jgi:hypothetical protein
MNYSNGKKIRVGDHVVLENGVTGVVVSDFDSGECIDEFASWDPNVELVAGGTLASGVLIRTEALGLLHYPTQDDDISFVGR